MLRVKFYELSVCTIHGGSENNDPWIVRKTIRGPTWPYIQSTILRTDFYLVEKVGGRRDCAGAVELE
uniref:Protein kinase domain-containing protein n=1 Tax=Steinernema glaseri TaxID=37863 RepID=A0A1I7YQ18_9BILA